MAPLSPLSPPLSCFSGGDLAPSLGGDGKFFRGPKFLNEVFFGKKFRFSRQKILMTFFSIGQVFLIFTLSFQILRIFTV